MSANDSEARLGKLSRQTFLSMWSYQNPFYDKGKELCDVLVVFGDDVIIVSDKVVRYSEDKDPAIAWNRWHRKAVQASVAQLRGALKTIRNSPGKIHLDARISSPFPLKFPDPGRARYHLVAVAQGCEEECSRRFGTPSLCVDSRTAGTDTPLAVGVHFPEFVHVVNRTTLDALFECFDTTADLIQYLAAKEALLSGRHVRIDGEENLIAAYMLNRNPRGVAPIDALCDISADGEQRIASGAWSSLRMDPSFLERRKWLAPSYVIDEIVEQVASEFLSGRLLAGQHEGMAYHAAAFQTLAAEPRMARLLIGEAVVDVLHEDSRTFWSVAVESVTHPALLYLWLIYPPLDPSYPDEVLEKAVGAELEKYVFVAMGKFPESHTVFGIAMPNTRSSRTSRVFRMAKKKIWTPEMQKRSEALGRREGILRNLESTTRLATRAL